MDDKKILLSGSLWWLLACALLALALGALLAFIAWAVVDTGDCRYYYKYDEKITVAK